MSASLFRGIPATLRASAASTSSSNTGTLSGSNIIPVGSAISLYLDVTANAGDSAGTVGFQVYLDTSPDGGTTWLNVEKFARIVSSTATQVINFRATGIGAVEAASQAWVTSTTTSTVVATNSVLSSTNRVRWTLGDNTVAAVAHTATFSVFAIVQPMGSTMGC